MAVTTASNLGGDYLDDQLSLYMISYHYRGTFNAYTLVPKAPGLKLAPKSWGLRFKARDPNNL